MRALSIPLTLAAMLAVGPRVWAADDKSADERAGQTVGEVSNEGIQDLNLSEEQFAKLQDIRKECQPKVVDAAKDLAAIVKEEVEKVRGVLTPEQREKVQAMKDLHKERRVGCLAAKLAHLENLDLTDAEVAKIAEIRKEYRPKIVAALEGLKGILSAEQRTAREEALKAGKSRREIMGSLNLTDDQKQKMTTIGQEVSTLVREEIEKIRDVLSDEQQQKLTELRDERRDRVRDRVAATIANVQDLNLTEEQKTSIATIRQEFRPKVHEAGNKLRAAIREEIAMIANAVK